MIPPRKRKISVVKTSLEVQLDKPLFENGIPDKVEERRKKKRKRKKSSPTLKGGPYCIQE
jgi:hypothetical protein